MFILSNLLYAIARILDMGLMMLYWLILIRAIISWVNPDPHNPLVQFLYKVTEPVLDPVRTFLPSGLRIGIDISPIIVFFIIIFLRSFLIRTLIDISMRIKAAAPSQGIGF